MPGSTFGQLFKIHTYGESHGKAIGVIIDGCPAGLAIDEGFINEELQRRKPGQSKITTQRNQDQKSKDYSHIKDSFRPSHADYTWQQKFGIRDYRGGGRSSARETAKLLLQTIGVSIQAFVSQVGHLKVEKPYQELDFKQIEQNIVRCADAEMAEKMIALIDETRKKGDTIGGIIQCVIKGTPVGIGQPVFDKLQADLAKAMLSINAVKGFEYGSGFAAAAMNGLSHNDTFENQAGKITTQTNYSGGIQGGISNGMDIYCKVAFKPVATVMRDQQSIDKAGNTVTVKGKGRHDPCVVPRAVPIVEAMAALVMADHYLRSRADKIS